MRILPDTRDLINLAERARPDTPENFNAYLVAGNHELVLSMTNIRELCGPLGEGGDFLPIRALLQSIEGMRHTCLKEAEIIPSELRSAVQAFNAGREYQCCEMYANRWDHTLLLPRGYLRGAADNWVNLRLDEIVYMIRRVDPQLFAPPHRHLPMLQQQFMQQRAALRARQLPTSQEHFVGSIGRHARSHNVDLPNGREDAFAEWIYEDATRCPGLRLHHETYRQLLINFNDVPEVGDFSDLAHVCAVPYVEAATLDNRMRNYCSQASRDLARAGACTDYRARLYRDLRDVMQRNP